MGLYIWHPSGKEEIESLEVIQRKAACCWARGAHGIISVTALLRDLSWLGLADRWRSQRLCLFYKILHRALDIPPAGIDISYHMGRTTCGSHQWKLNLYLLVTNIHHCEKRQFRGQYQSGTNWDPKLSALTSLLPVLFRVGYLPTLRQILPSAFCLTRSSHGSAGLQVASFFFVCFCFSILGQHTNPWGDEGINGKHSTQLPIFWVRWSSVLKMPKPCDHYQGSLVRGWPLVLAVFWGHWWLEPLLHVLIKISTDKFPLI